VLNQSYEMIQELNVAIEQLSLRNDALVKKNARLSGDSKVDRDAYNSVNDSLISLQREILILKEELVFYRGIVSPAQAEYGVNLQEFSVGNGSNKESHSFKLVLTKSGKSNYSIRGDVIITAQGLLDGQVKTLTLGEISSVKKSELRYSFRYFQIFDGDLSFPKQFYPEVIKVVVKSRTKKVKSINSTFNWAELVSGEE